MIETTNNIIFWVGYFTALAIVFCIGCIAWVFAYMKILTWNTRLRKEFLNRLWSEKMKSMDDDEFEKWVEKQRAYRSLVNKK